MFPILIPCYRFTEPRDATAYIEQLRVTLTPKQMKNLVVAKSGKETFVSLPDWGRNFTPLLTRLFYVPAFKQKERGVYEVELDSQSPPPINAEILFLALQGVHRYTKFAPKLPADLSWLAKVIKGPRECANSCESSPDGELRSIQVADHPQSLFPFGIFAGPKGRMAVFSSELTYCTEGEKIGTADGCITYTLFLSFSVGSSKKDVQLHIRCEWTTAQSADPARPINPDVSGKDTIWQALYDRARKRFRKRCSPYTRELDSERVKMVERLTALRAHTEYLTGFRSLVALAAEDADTVWAWWRTFWSLQGTRVVTRRASLARTLRDRLLAWIHARIRGQETTRLFSYRARVRALGWDDALTTVEVPWHLLIVFQEHLWERGRMVSLEDTRSLFMQLLEAHPCSDERRIRLWEMAETHIAPQDPFWETEEYP